MNCNKVENILIKNDLNNLPAEVMEHCANCDKCQRKLMLLQQDLELLKIIKLEHCNIDVSTSIMSKVQNHKKHKTATIYKITIPLLVAASIALAIMFNTNINNTVMDNTSNLVAMNSKSDDQIIDEMLTEIYIADDNESEEIKISNYYYIGE